MNSQYICAGLISSHQRQRNQALRAGFILSLSSCTVTSTPAPDMLYTGHAIFLSRRRRGQAYSFQISTSIGIRSRGREGCGILNHCRPPSQHLQRELAGCKIGSEQRLTCWQHRGRGQQEGLSRRRPLRKCRQRIPCRRGVVVRNTPALYRIALAAGTGLVREPPEPRRSLTASN